MQWLRVVTWSLVIISLSIEILSNYELLFNSENFYSEYHNSQKVMHFTAMIAAILLRIKQDEIGHGRIVVPITTFVIFGFLTLGKLYSPTRNKINQILYLGFYFLTLFLEILNLVSNWTPLAK